MIIYPGQDQQLHWYPLLLQLQANFIMEQASVAI